jgi:Tyrosine phosphatase family
MRRSPSIPDRKGGSVGHARHEPMPILQPFPGAAALERLKGLYRRLFGLNFGTVESGRVYRCARPGTDLPRLVETYQLASVLDFERGLLAKSLGAESWCIAQVRGDHERNIDYFQFPIPFDRRPLREELLALITLFERGRYPLLIHCDTGADRTGLAVGIYLMAIRNDHPQRAFREAFAPRFGHVAILGTGHLHEPFREYADWLREGGFDHTPARLRSWLKDVYR